MRAFAITVALCASATLAQAEEKRDLGAHEHGVGALNIAFEGGEVAMELEAPGTDIVGFEHPAETAEDRAAIDAAIAVLAKPTELFRLPEAARCTVVEAEVALLGEDDDHHEEHGHAEHHEEHEAHDEHAGSDHDEGEGEVSHTEFRAEYRLTCAEPGAIDRIEFGYFAIFPNAEELEVQLISDQGSKGFEVVRDAPVLDLAGSI